MGGFGAAAYFFPVSTLRTGVSGVMPGRRDAKVLTPFCSRSPLTH